jgi:hypothetical protein
LIFNFRKKKDEFLNVRKSKAKVSAVRINREILWACTQISTQIVCGFGFYSYICGVNQRYEDMQIVTTREFRANQKKYFELAERETIFVSRRNAAPIVIYAAKEEDFPSKEELSAIQRGIEDIKNGRTFKMGKNESLDDFLNRIEGECNV